MDIHIAVSESNLVGFPVPGIAKWKDNAPNAEEVNAKIDAFLARFEHPARRGQGVTAEE